MSTFSELGHTGIPVYFQSRFDFLVGLLKTCSVKLINFVNAFVESSITYVLGILYFLYIRLPFLVVSTIFTYIWEKVVSCISSKAQREDCMKQSSKRALSILIAMQQLSPVDVLNIFLKTGREMFPYYGYSDIHAATRPRSSSLTASLVSYEETDDEEDVLVMENKGSRSQRLGYERRIVPNMHDEVPWHRFRARIRLHPHTDSNESSKQPITTMRPSVQRSNLLERRNMNVNMNVNGLTRSDKSNGNNNEDVYSPASFPSTPHSRQYVLSRSQAQADTLVFAARDKLRQQALISESNDEFSRHSAEVLQNSGQFAVFDSSFYSDGLLLTYGAHCVQKIGSTTCGSCRSMVPIPFDVYIYIEFSVTTSERTVPELAIGLAPAETPLNSLVGSVPGSLSLLEDGQLMVSGITFQTWKDTNIPIPYELEQEPQLIDSKASRTSKELIRVTPGCTIGFLVYIPSGFREEEEAVTPKDSYQMSTIATSSSPSSYSTYAAPSPDSKENSLKIVTTSKQQSQPASVSSDNYDFSLMRNILFFQSLKGLFQAIPQDLVYAIDKNFSESRPDYIDNSAAANIRYDDNVEEDRHLSTEGNENSQEEVDIHNVGVTFIVNIDGNILCIPPSLQQSIDLLLIHSTSSTATSSSPPSSSLLYPTVSLISKNTNVWCRFCADDILHKSRSAIGAPPGVRVYALDGSLVLSENDN